MVDETYAGLPILEEVWPSGTRMSAHVDREWIITNGLGSFASSSVSQVNTRRYHGWFIPSLPGLGRMMMVPRVTAVVRRGSERFILAAAVRRFRLLGLVPEWEYEALGSRLQQRLVLVYGQNTLYASWRHLGGHPCDLALRPFTVFRPLEKLPLEEGPDPTAHLRGDTVELLAAPTAPLVRIRLFSRCAAPFIGRAERSAPLLYRVDRGRGTEHIERQKSPGYFVCQLEEGDTLTLGMTVEDWSALEMDPLHAFEREWQRQRRLIELAPEPCRKNTAGRLVLACDQFVIKPQSRPEDEALARAIGEDARSVIAGYPWFTDWGRDTMIALEGLTLATGRLREGAAILRTFSHYVRDGLLPNLFPEGGREGLYHTADATLWFFHAIGRYLARTRDEGLLRDLFPTLTGIVDHHLRGTRFGIHVDPKDGLLVQGAAGFQLTWMDAKVDGWVVTPRRGKAVEINALWYAALRAMAEWAQRLGSDPARYTMLAGRVSESFNRRFWNEARACLYDVIDGEEGHDPAIRPNQIFAISLDHPVLQSSRWRSVVDVVERELVTPLGLRSLSPSHPDFKRNYDGDLRARDAAYHQGTVWAWLIGHFVDAWRKTHDAPPSAARRWLLELERHLASAGIGQVSEIFDATEPFEARGCYAQAWSTAELLRVWLATMP